MLIRWHLVGWTGALALLLGSASCGGGGDVEEEKAAPPPIEDDVTLDCADLVVYFEQCGLTSDMAEGEAAAQCVTSMQGNCTSADMQVLQTFAECLTVQAQCEGGALGIPEDQMVTVFMGTCMQHISALTPTCQSQVMALAAMLM